MIEACGIEKFIPLDEFRRNEEFHEQDDIVFIEVGVGFFGEPLGKIYLTMQDHFQ